MERVAIDDEKPTFYGDDADRRALSDLLGATDVAVNHYRIAPGEGFPGGLHAHLDQEEIFVVLDGEATFETLVPRDAGDDADRAARAEDDDRAVGAEDDEWEAGEVEVGEGEVVRFAPGEHKSGQNDANAEERLVVLALGAPRDSEELRVPLDCPECDHRDLRPEWTEEGTVLACPDCGVENVPEGCPHCGAEMDVALGEENDTVVVCPDCGAEAATPFET